MLKFLNFIVGIPLSIIFIFIPTLLLNPKKYIPYIEEDLCVSFPRNYNLADKYADWLAFEEHVDITFEFSEDEYVNFEKQTGNYCKNGQWVKVDDGLNFKLADGFIRENNYFFEAWLDPSKKQLRYIFTSF